jgi:hypothetical protein
MIPILIPIVLTIDTQTSGESLCKNNVTLSLSSDDFFIGRAFHHMHNVQRQVDSVGDGDNTVSGLTFNLI